jgi:hypothetical protein
MQRLFTKAFGAARLEYIMTSDKFETNYHKPGGTACGALYQMVHRVVDVRWDEPGCGIWSYLTHASKKGKKLAIVSAYIVCKQTNPGDLTSSKQQIGIMYEYEELRPYLLDPYKQTLIDLQYSVEELKVNGHNVLIMMDANQAEEQTFQPQNHSTKLVTKKGFRVGGSIDGSLKSFMRNCGLIDFLWKMHEGVVPNNHARGSMQIEFPLATVGVAEHVLGVGMLNRSVLQSEHSGLFVDLLIEGIFGQNPDKLVPHKVRNLKLDYPRISNKYRKILHKQFECHNTYRRVKKISERGKEASWNLED